MQDNPVGRNEFGFPVLSWFQSHRGGIRVVAILVTVVFLVLMIILVLSKKELTVPVFY